MPRLAKPWPLLFAAAVFMLSCNQAASAGGRLIGTGGVTEIEGAAGGGVVPWALIAGTETRDEVGGTGFYTHFAGSDYSVDAAGVAIGINERLELSYARQTISISNAITTPVNAALMLPAGTLNGTSVSQDIIGAKIKIAGDAVYDQNSLMPQIAVGVQHKVNDDFRSVLGITGVPEVLGAKHAAGTDFYLAFTKVFIGAAGGLNLAVDGTIRETNANENGLLGFGGPKHDGYTTQGEGSIGVFLNPNTVVGAEYRTMPNNFATGALATQEQAWKDLFLAYFPNKAVGLTLAYASLGAFPSGIGTHPVLTEEQLNGLYLSGQVSF
jgi:Protein of unknown function (DUF3034)